MKLIRCNNGHFYDAEKYSACPHCSGGNVNPDASDVTVGLEPGGTSVPDMTIGNNMNTQPNMGSGMNNGNPIDSSMGGMGGMNNMGAMNGMGSNVIGGGFANMPTVPVSSGMNGWNTVDEGDDENDKTISIYSMGNTASSFGGMSIEPVVGWLVCIEGKNYGQDYRLRAGKNYIGRSERMDVALTGEETVSRDRHVIVLFEPRQSIFLVQPGESKELAYLNDELVLQSQVLKIGDILTVGEVKLLFVPFCSADGFQWARR